MPDLNEQQAFLIELRDLLARYDAEITAECDESSDLHGVTGECMGVSIGREDRFHDRVSAHLGMGWGVGPESLTEVIGSAHKAQATAEKPRRAICRNCRFAEGFVYSLNEAADDDLVICNWQPEARPLSLAFLEKVSIEAGTTDCPAFQECAE